MIRQLLSALCVLIVLPAYAQDFPVRPLRLIVPFAPGGATDIPARLVSPKLQESLGQPVSVENRPGAGGIIGIEIAAKAPADGYTLLVATNGELVMNPSLYPKLPYDVFRDFVPVSVMLESPMLLVVGASSAFGTASEVLAAARAKPGVLTYSTAGTGSTSHVLTELFALQAGIRLIHVPYKGGAPAAAAMASGEVSLSFLSLGTAVNLVRGGKAKALAVTSASRHPSFPDWPTTSEIGVPFNDGLWVGMAAPAGVPRAIVDRLSGAVARAVNLPDVRERLLQFGSTPVGSSADEAAERIKREFPRYAGAIKAAGIRPE
jgi:tripartite-type tricarboxylate transporter receptor subunit TctC